MSAIAITGVGGDLGGRVVRRLAAELDLDRIEGGMPDLPLDLPPKPVPESM